MGEEQKPEEPKAEEARAEEKKEEKAEEKPPAAAEEEEEEKGEPKPPSPIVLYVDLHCVGCAKKIEKSLLRITGVVGVEIDMAKNQVTVKGAVEAEAVCDKIMKKTKRSAKVLSSPAAPEKPPVIPAADEVVASPPLSTVQLNVNMHCEACAQQLKRKILRMKGVTTVETELNCGKVTVTGTMDAEKLVDYVYRRTKKQAKIVPQPEPEVPAEPAPEPEKATKEEEGKKEGEKPAKDGEEEKKEEEVVEKAAEEEKKEVSSASEEQSSMQRMMYCYQPLYVIDRIPPPQLFSDENPNACSIS